MKATLTTRTTTRVDLDVGQIVQAVKAHFKLPEDADIQFEVWEGILEGAYAEWTREETIENPFDGKEGEHDA